MSDSQYEYTEFEFDSVDALKSSRFSLSTMAFMNTPLFQFDQTLDNVAYVKVLEAQIPFSFYLINATNKQFILKEWYNFTPGNVRTLRGEANVTLPEGNYNSTTIIPVLQDALNDASADITLSSSVGTTRAYVATFDSATGLLSIATPAMTDPNSDWLLRIGTVNGANQSPTTAFDTTVLGYLGMNIGPAFTDLQGTNSLASNTVTPYTLSFTQLLNLSGPFYIYLNSEKLGGLINLWLPAGVHSTAGGPYGPELTKIPIMTDAFSVTNWVDPCPERWFPVANATFAGSCDFYCTLGVGKTPIDFNGLGFSFKLGILRELPGKAEYVGGGVANDRVVARTWQ
jgi:hypothetical protein